MKFLNMLLENKNGDVKLTPNALSAYGTERLKKEERATLVLKDITFEDSTTYKCILRGETGTLVESAVQLIVTGKASVTHSVLPIKELGGSATFTCSANAVSSQYFTWMREGQKIVNNSKYEIASVIGSSQLTIKNISISAHGYYVCDATVNVNQPSSARGFLGVTSLKEDTDMCPKGDQNAIMNKTTTICCPVRGFPPPEVTWKLPDKTVLTTVNTMLPIKPEKDKDFGNFTCSAINVGTPIGPFVISLKQEGEGQRIKVLPVEDVNFGTQDIKPGDKFAWYPVKDADDYFVRVSGESINDTRLLGQKTSLEIPYNTLEFKDPDKKPKSDAVDVTIAVLAIDKNNNVIGKGKEGGFQRKIKNAAATLEVSFISVIMLFIMVIIFH
ncbi:Leucine rich repeat C-terminal domain [Desmophyllum pertusum]|uniref:Leucine rich repeat C-terminal domain n=1 Tax=Desmophyllum pertusum TaxID=174260 RepID=A0A9W9YYK1_9CNID|nr:Leucine rich repeat C-terminal domain [Desmophyllum pertusum]